jgi:hypothetical protein
MYYYNNVTIPLHTSPLMSLSVLTQMDIMVLENVDNNT